MLITKHVKVVQIRRATDSLQVHIICNIGDPWRVFEISNLQEWTKVQNSRRLEIPHSIAILLVSSL